MSAKLTGMMSALKRSTATRPQMWQSAALAALTFAVLSVVTGCVDGEAGGVRESRVVLAPDAPDTADVPDAAPTQGAAGAPAGSVTAVTVTRVVAPETAAWDGGVARYPSR